MKKVVLGLLSAAAVGTLLFVAAPPSFADVVVKIAPPAMRVETRPPAPGPEFAWRPGYWRWGGKEHVWVGGEYVRRPHPGAEWIEGRWDRRGGDFVWIEGRWK